MTQLRPIHRRCSQSRRAFSLVEVLIVVGIIAVLAAILIPMVSRASRNAKRMRVQQDFQTIAVALEAYKQDHGDYPRTEGAANIGFAVLGKALIGPYGDGVLPNGNTDQGDPPQHPTSKPYAPGESSRGGTGFYLTLNEAPTGTGTSAPSFYYTYFDPHDGQDGPGFKTRPGAAQVFGPYLAAGKVKNRGLAILDPDDRPILYFPARPGRPNISAAAAAYGPYVGQDVRSLFNANDNFELFRHKQAEPDSDVLSRIRIMFGDYNENGIVDNGEKAISQPYVLIAPGPDGVFGPANFEPSGVVEDNRRAVEKADDVTNMQ